MSYRLKAHETFEQGVRRMAREQVDRALGALTLPQEGNLPEGNLPPNLDEAIHDARRAFKKVRALLRLVRDELGEKRYKRENVCYRDAGRRLAAVCDSFVRVQTLDRLSAYFADHLAADAFSSVRSGLTCLHQDTAQRVLEEEQAIETVVQVLQEARPRIEKWRIRNEPPGAFYPGLRRVYKRGRKRLQDTYREPSTQLLRDWRKRVKYLWYHTRVLRPIWSPVMKKYASSLHTLSTQLGVHYDLGTLGRTLLEHPELVSSEEQRQLLLGLIDRRRLALQTSAQLLGERIYTEKSRDFADRIAAYWNVWQRSLERPELKLVIT